MVMIPLQIGEYTFRPNSHRTLKLKLPLKYFLMHTIKSKDILRGAMSLSVSGWCEYQ